MIGKSISGYHIQARLGSGELGTVYKAQDSRNDRTVALKILTAEVNEDPDARDLFLKDTRAVAELATLRTQGHRVYVHCTAGLGRGPLTVLAYLVLVEGYSPETAIHLIHTARPGAVPAWEAFHGCCEDLVNRHRDAIEQRAYALYEEGVHQDAYADWQQAQAEVLRSVLWPMN